jgi:two-component system response regulator NreC
MYRIFIADDHTLIRQGLKRILEENDGYEVIGETGDGLQIVPDITRLSPDAIILDISMPNLRGIDAISRIRKVDKKIKILILTMHRSEDYVYECLVSGAHGYLLKEDADTELLAALEAIRRDNIFVSSSFAEDVIKEFVGKKRESRAKTSPTALTAREQQVLRLIAEGMSNKEVAKALAISVRTVEHHRLNIMRKLNVSNVAGLIKYAVKARLVSVD